MPRMRGIDWSPLVNTLIVILSGLSVMVWASIRKWIEAKARNDSERAILDRVASFFETEVQAIEQAVLPEVKEAFADGKLTPEEAKRIRDMAIDRVKRNLGDEGVKKLASAIGSRPVQEYLESVLESKVLKR